MRKTGRGAARPLRAALAVAAALWATQFVGHAAADSVPFMFERFGTPYTLNDGESVQLPGTMQGGGGILNVSYNCVGVMADPVFNLNIVFQQTAEPPGPPFMGAIDPLFTGDLDAILADNSLDRGDVFDVMFMRTVLISQTDVELTRTDVVTSPDSLIIGDIDNILAATILQGSVDATFTQTVTTTPQFADVLTIKLYGDVSPPPGDGDGDPTVIPTPAALPAGLALLALAAARRRRSEA